jgi:hypothetical protein
MLCQDGFRYMRPGILLCDKMVWVEIGNSLFEYSCVFQTLVFQTLVFQTLVFQTLVFQTLGQGGRVQSGGSAFV